MIEIMRGPSERFPGRTNFVIYGRTPEEVNAEIQNVADEFNVVQFTNPEHVDKARWGAMGQGWNVAPEAK